MGTLLAVVGNLGCGTSGPFWKEREYFQRLFDVQSQTRAFRREKRNVDHGCSLKDDTDRNGGRSGLDLSDRASAYA